MAFKTLTVKRSWLFIFGGLLGIVMFFPSLSAQFSLNAALISIKNSTYSSQTNLWLDWAGRNDRVTAKAEWYRGYLDYLGGQHPTAIQTWRQSSESAARLIWFGKAEVRQKNYEQALIWFDLSLQVAPTVEGQALRGDAYMAIQQYFPAIEAYETALELAPENVNYQIALARALIAGQTNLDRAEQLLEQASALRPGSEEIYRTLAGLAEVRGNLTQALGWWEQAASVENPLVDTLLKLGDLYQTLASPEKAVEIYRRAVERAPTSPSARLALARAYLVIENWGEALQEAEAVLAQSPDMFEAWLIAGKAYLALGLTDQALEMLVRASEIMPDHPEVQELLSQLTASAPG